MNGWKDILKQMYKILENENSEKLKEKFHFKIGSETVVINCDYIGKIILKSCSFSSVRYLEEILEVKKLFI